jgi:hypothetical protein
MLTKGMLVSAVVLSMVLVSNGLAGDLDSPAAPGNPGSAMYTLDDIYNRLNTRTSVAKRAGAFTEPSAAPGSTGHTTDEIMALINERAPVEKTGQTTSYAIGDDGGLEKGVASPSPRFTDNGNGTVTDNLTGLIWLKDADAGDGTETWADALTLCNALANGQQGLSDGSSAGDWRLPNVKELQSLIDFSQVGPGLLSAHPFAGVQSLYYWSSSSYANNTVLAWRVNLSNGSVGHTDKTNPYYVWPVRGGE